METPEGSLLRIQFDGCRLELGLQTDQGRERENNEDRMLTAPERGLFIISDGMGGMAAGERAAEEAIASLDRELSAERLHACRQRGEQTLNELLEQAVGAANQDIQTLQQEYLWWKGMGCTVVVGVLHQGHLHLINLGDSRAYLCRPGASESAVLTADHTVAAELVKQGDMSPEEARHHNLRNRLTSALGHLDSHYPPYLNTVALRADDRIVLCSDGLWDMVDDADIALITLEATTAQQAAEALTAAANEAGGQDNITIIVLHVLETPADITHTTEDPHKTLRREHL
jgi:serine/threonine protein phosphatase PrpC